MTIASELPVKEDIHITGDMNYGEELIIREVRGMI